MVRDLLSSNLDKLRTVLEAQGVPVDKLAVAPAQTPPGYVPLNGQTFGSAAHDGRSAGQYQQDPRSNQRRPAEDDSFDNLLRRSAENTPLDLVA